MALKGFCPCCTFLVLYLSSGVTTATMIEPPITSELMTDFIRRLEHLEQRDSAQQREIVMLQQQLSQEREIRHQLEDTVKTLMKDVSTMDVTNHSSDGKLSVKRDGQSDVRQPRVTRWKDSDKALVENLSKGADSPNLFSASQPRTRQTPPSLSIAFFATLGNHLTHIGTNQSVVFDNVVTNEGNGYNSHIGIFIAPVSGTYTFSVTLTTLVNINSHYNFAVNGETVSKIYVRGSESPSQSASQTIVMHMKAYDDVFVRNEDSDRSLNGGWYSSFSGFLIREDYPTTGPAAVGK